MRRGETQARARSAGFLAASLVLASCGGGGSGWDENARVTGNACPPVKRVVKKAEIERALDGKVDEGRLSQFPLLLDIPTCRFVGRGRTGPASASLAVVEGLADDLLEQFMQQHANSNPLVLDDLGDEAVWFEEPRMLFVRQGSRLLVMQLFLTGPRFNRYRERATGIADKAVDRL